jgi:hypothetical protein
MDGVSGNRNSPNENIAVTHAVIGDIMRSASVSADIFSSVAFASRADLLIGTGDICR